MSESQDAVVNVGVAAPTASDDGSTSSTTSWCGVVACLIGLSVDARLSGAAIEIEQCVDAMTNGMIRESMVASTIEAAKEIGRRVSIHYTAVPGNALHGSSADPGVVQTTAQKRKSYRMVLKMLTNMYFITTDAMLLLRYVLASSMLSDVFVVVPSSSSSSSSSSSNININAFDVVAMATKIVRIWKEDDLDGKLESSSPSSNSEDDYDDWGWLHDLLLMLRMCESYKFATAVSTASSASSSTTTLRPDYGRILIETLSLIKTPVHQYDIDISAFQQLHQNFIGQLKEREGRRSQFTS